MRAHFKAKIKNTGNKETTYAIVGKRREGDTEEWESGGKKRSEAGPRAYGDHDHWGHRMH
jgi:hypothetical protein